MRIAVLDLDRCKPKDCNFLCMRMCPIVRGGKDAIVVSEESGKPVISEGLCTGCGICVKKCPYGAIIIVNLPEEVGLPVHQYGVNGFRLYNLPTPKKGVVGIVGCNGIGKTTALRILAGELKPNLGGDARWDEILERFRGREIQNYLELLSEGKIKAAYKPQYVEGIPRYVKGKVGNILKRRDENGKFEELVEKLGLANALDKDIKSLSGGELQKTAVCACLMKDADIYLLDEPSSYLDVRERLNLSKVVRSMQDKYVLVVEHDLIVLDYLSEYVHVIFGLKGAYGIISSIKGVRVGINEYLDGFLKSENMRFREEIKFEVTPPSERKKTSILMSYPALEKEYPEFRLHVDGGTLHTPNVVGVLGPNATGKTTFVKMLAGEVPSDNTKLDLNVRVSYKPQYVKTSRKLVRSLGIKPELIEKFRLTHLLERRLSELSGGELQKAAIADCLTKEADVYLLDEPSAYLDVEERLSLAKYLKKYSFENSVSIMTVDHDILLLDYLSGELIVFDGVPGKEGKTSKPLGLRAGMNKFLKKMDVTFRRDPNTGRPRANKPESMKDRKQKSSGEYYYVG